MIVSIALMFMLSFCASVDKIKMDVLEPAEIRFPDDVYSMAVLMPEPEIIINTRTYDEIDANPKSDLWTGITDIASISPRFNAKAIKLIQEYNDSIRSDTMQWNTVNHLTDSMNVDALIVMHQVTLEDSLDREVVYEYNYSGYYFVYQIHSSIEWRIYDPRNQSIFNENSYKEKYVWESYADDEQEAIRELVNIREAFASAAYWTGVDVGHILFPYWEEASRFYYIRGNKYFRKAADQADKENWQQAIDIWKKNFKLNDDVAAYRAAHNIAFACEMLGKIDMAINWAEKALQIGESKRTREYLEILKERKDKLEKIDEQMPI